MSTIFIKESFPADPTTPRPPRARRSAYRVAPQRDGEGGCSSRRQPCTGALPRREADVAGLETARRARAVSRRPRPAPVESARDRAAVHRQKKEHVPLMQDVLSLLRLRMPLSASAIRFAAT